MTAEWNTRYVRYSESMGRSPDDQLQHDSATCGGGVMAGYIIWINNRWRAFRDAAGINLRYVGTEQHVTFDAWLKDGAPK